jgi:hypothetical protein
MLGETTRVPANVERWLRHVYDYIGPGAVRDRTGDFRPETRADRLRRAGLLALAAAGLLLFWRRL